MALHILEVKEIIPNTAQHITNVSGSQGVKNLYKTYGEIKSI